MMGAIYYCQNKQKYQICVIPKYFSDFEKDVEKNIFDYNFLFWYHTKLCKELIKLFDHKKGCAECFQGEYKFRRCDWYKGEYWSINLSDSIHYNEKIQTDWLKREKLPLPPNYIEDTIDLTCDETS